MAQMHPLRIFATLPISLPFPDDAFITIAASQVYRLYVNGTFIGSNQQDFLQGMFPRAYMYDLTSSLHVGMNVIAVRVANIDEQTPLLIANLGMVHGRTLTNSGTGTNWQATMQTLQVYQPDNSSMNTWATTAFDASSWLNSRNSVQLTYLTCTYRKSSDLRAAHCCPMDERRCHP